MERQESRVVPRVSRRAALQGIGGGVIAALALGSDPAAAKPHPDGKNGTLEAVAPLARRGCTATPLHGGSVLVAGGLASAALAVVQIFDPRTGGWYDAAPMNCPRYNHAAVALPDGRVLVTGGMSATQPLASAEIYDPREDDWELVAPMSGPRRDHAAALLDGFDVLVTGGFFEAPLASVEIFHVQQNRWVLL